VFLAYSGGGIQHKAKLKYIDGVDIEAVSACRADATAFANVFKALIQGLMLIDGWGLEDPTGTVIYSEPFTPAISGTGSGSFSSLSHTITLSGLGVPTGVGSAKGKTRVVVFDGGHLVSGTGVKESNVASDAGWAAFSSWLHSNLRCFADYYGQHAEPKTYLTHQYNARAQRVHGT
jgi:hypothetical protein